MGSVAQAGVIIVTPYALVAEGIRALLSNSHPDMRVEHIASCDRSSFDFTSAELRLIVMDTAQAFYNYRLVSELRRRMPHVALVGIQQSDTGRSVLSVFDDTISLGMELNIVQGVLQSHLEDGEGKPSAPFLSSREIQVLRLLAQGKTAKEIGQELCISTHTVTSHRKNLSAKLGIKSVSGMAIYAVHLNLIDPNEIQHEE